MADLEIQKGVRSVMHVVYGQQNNNMSTHTIFSMRALIDINGLTLTDFLAMNVVKEGRFLFILAESMLKNTIAYILTNKHYAALSARQYLIMHAQSGPSHRMFAE